jgi:type VI secretion system protein ImpA
MSIPVDKLLQPISAEQPCGPDLSYDPRYDELESLLKGRPEVEIGSVIKPAEPPDWAALREKSAAFLGAAKHLRPAVILACAALRTEGLPGFRDGVKLLRGLLETFWGDLHPRLDPDDNNDPQQRLNILGGLTAPRNPGSDVAGWLQIVDYLHQAPFCRPRGVAPVSLDLLAGTDTPAAPAEEGGEA